MDLTKKPENADLEFPLGSTYQYWHAIRDFELEKYPAAVEDELQGLHGRQSDQS